MCKVLVVEDLELARELLVNLLKDARYQVIEAADGAVALRLARAESPDLIISDVLMPEMDGYELVRQLRRDPATARIGIIFYSAVFNEQEACDLARDCGVTRIIKKPTEPKRILDIMAEVLKAKGTEDISPLPASFDHRHEQLLTGKLIQQIDALRQSEERFRLLAEHASDMVFRYRLRPTCAWEYVNCASTLILGYEPGEYYVDSKLLDKIVHPDSRFDLESCIGTKCVAGKTTEICWSHKDGRTVWTEIRSTPLHDGMGNLVAVEGIARDITVRKEMERERQLQQARKLESLGTLAGGIAHHFNNILATMILNTEMAMDEVSRKSPSWRNLERVLKAGNRAGDLVEQILAFSRQSGQKKQPCDITPIVKEVLKLIEATLPSFIEISCSAESCPDGSPALVLADPAQIHHVLMILCDNAVHAMSEKGGKLSVDLLPVDLDARTASDHPQTAPGPYVLIRVSDTGHGMEPSIMDRVFDPFFTTKRPGEGTGLGLSMAYGLVQSHDGSIRVESEPGLGATFEVLLPRI